MKTKLVLKLIFVLVLLLTVVLYKMNDFYRQEKLLQAETQVKRQITSIKTSVAGQLATIRNVISSYDIDIKENQINWVQLDPLFALARVQKKADGSYTVHQIVGRSGSVAEKWTEAYLEKALSIHKQIVKDSTQVHLFKDRAGGKYVVLIFNNTQAQQTAVVGSAEYFQKFFGLNRDGRLISLLVTKNHVLVAHTESDYIASLSDEEQLSTKKYIIDKEEIIGSNLIAVAYSLKKSVAAFWVVPWSMVGLVCGFGCVLIGLLFYGLDPIEKKVARYKKQERDQIFNTVLKQEVAISPLANLEKNNSEVEKATDHPEVDLIQKTRQEAVERAQQVFSEPTEEISDVSIAGPLKQALANLDVLFRNENIQVETIISASLSYSLYYGLFIKTFENILRNAIESLASLSDDNKSEKKIKRIVVRAYDIEDRCSVIEVQDNGIGLAGQDEAETHKVWQPFYTTKSKADHMGLGLTESLSSVRRAGGDITIEQLPGSGVLVKLIMKKDKMLSPIETVQQETVKMKFTNSEISFSDNNNGGKAMINQTKAVSEEIQMQLQQQQNSVIKPKNENVSTLVKLKDEELMDIDLDQVLSLDEMDSSYLFTPQKINIEPAAPLSVEKEVALSAVMMATEIKEPNFKFEKKNYAVDHFPTRIRRPEKS